MAYSFSGSAASAPALVTESEIASRHRRAHLVPIPNPNQRHNYVVTLSGMPRLQSLASSPATTLRYVPDRNVLAPIAFTAYLDALGGMTWSTLEEVAATMLDDINSELIPRWVHIRMAVDGEIAGQGHSVDLEDHLPNWDHPDLLARLDRR